MQDALIDIYYVCIKKKQLVERITKHIINIKSWKIDIVNSGL